MDAVSTSIRNVRSPSVTFRARFSAITEKDIKHAMNTLVFPNENESRSVDGRQELDLRIGCAFTRFQTKFFQGRYGDLDSSLISYGPCQTPTLGFCVQRHDEIQQFKPESFWYVQVTIEHDQKLEWQRVRIFEKEVAMIFYNIVREQKEAIVESVTSKDNFKSRPLALNTVELMRSASSGLGKNFYLTLINLNLHFVQELDLMLPCKLPKNFTRKDTFLTPVPRQQLIPQILI